MKKNLTLKQKDRIVRKIYQKYQRSQLDILYLNQHYNYYPQVNMLSVKETGSIYKKPDSSFLIQLERKQELEDFIGVVNQVHTHLCKETYFFIENEYLNFYDVNWWTPYFSRASYYRFKHQALDEFIECIMNLLGENEIYNFLK